MTRRLFKLTLVLCLLGCAWLMGPRVGAAHALADTPKKKTRSKGDDESGEERRWVKHRIVPHEQLEDIAERYGVSSKEIVRWNKRLKKKKWIYAGRTLKIYARRFPPPREKIQYEVQFGDSWTEIANKFNVQESDLHKWNRKVPRRFKAGTMLTVWTNPIAPIPEEEAEAVEPLPKLEVRGSGYSVGKPNRGRLVNGVRLPDSDLYTVRDPDKAWASSHTVLQLHTAIATWRRDSGFDGLLVIGAISKRGGGRFRPHRSHQSGRDVDIRLPKRAGADLRSNSASDIDWRASWQLIKAFSDTGEIEYIFLDWHRQKRLYRAAKSMGVSDEELAKMLQYPRPRRSNNGLVRHAEGHIIHIHIRIKCSPKASRCISY